MRSLSLATASCLAGAAFLFAAEATKHEHSAKVGVAKAGKGPTSVQKTCPVSGKPIKQDVFIEYEGQKIYFCCPGCPARFKESPTTYLPAVYKQVYPQEVQLKCPVMGGPLDGKTFADYQGRRIGFCCDGCPQEFKANPAKYLPKLKEASTEQVHCPVTGKAIDAKQSFQYQGKTVYFNSPEALAKFKADPAKYAAALRPEAGLVARGGTADDDLFLVLASDGKTQLGKRKDLKATAYEGKSYLLRGDDGLKAFQADPARYAKALDTEMKKRSAAEKPSAAGTGGGTTTTHHGHH